MSTAGEKFFADLTNGEVKYMSRVTGVRVEEWEQEVSAVEVNGVVLAVASKRLALKTNTKAMTIDEIDELTPAATAEKLEEVLGELGYLDDEEADAGEDFPEDA